MASLQGSLLGGQGGVQISGLKSPPCVRHGLFDHIHLSHGTSGHQAPMRLHAQTQSSILKTSRHQDSRHQLSGRQLSGRQLSGRQLSGHQLSGHQLSGNQDSRQQLSGHQGVFHHAAGRPFLRGSVRAMATGQTPLTTAVAVTAPTKERTQIEVPSSFEYNQVMKQRMANPYEYHHDLGMYYTRITPRIIMGSQPQTPEDVDTLARAEGVGVILNVQEDKDVEYWGVDLPAVQRRSQELGVEYLRRPAVDFDPQSLRRSLPGMVGVVAHAVAAGKTVYVHCTAGLGRSPAAVIAYLFWFSEPRLDLRKAYDLLTALRPCGPRWEAIRGATYDLAKDSPYQPPFEQLPSFAFTDVADWERNLIRRRVFNS